MLVPDTFSMHGKFDMQKALLVYSQLKNNCYDGFFESIFSGGGLILSYIVERYHGIAVFNPVVNGRCPFLYKSIVKSF